MDMLSQEAFLEYLANEIKFNCSTYKYCFLLRFDPENYGRDHQYIAGIMDDNAKKWLNRANFEANTINQIISTVAKRVAVKFQEEMKADGVDIDMVINNNQRGCPKPEHSPYHLTYQWIWEKKFPRVAWDFSKKISTYAGEKLTMKPIINDEATKPIIDDEATRAPNLDEIPVPNNFIIKDKRYRLQVSLEENGYLVLIGEDSTGDKYIMCPSQAYAYVPSVILESTTSLELPPADDSKGRAKSLKYSEIGKEYFLAIVTEDPLKLSWVCNSEAKAKDIELNDERLKEIFNLLGKQANSKVFHKEFEIVELAD